jgi:hypothetical protein
MMQRLSYPEFCESAERYAGDVSVTSEIERFCSGPMWLRAAHDYLHELSVSEEETRHFIVEDDGCWLVFVEREPSGIFFPFERAWVFGCPLIGEPQQSVELLLAAVEEYSARPVGFWVGGVCRDGELHRRLAELPERGLCDRYSEFDGTNCLTLDLSEGFDAWLARRSKKFRKSLRQAGGLEGLEIEELDCASHSSDEIFQRILGIEHQCYKWERGESIFQSETYGAFYRELLETLHRSGNLRVRVAVDPTKRQDLAYIFGGMDGDAYRGLQMSYIDGERCRGLGNALQIENIRRCIDEGVSVYDLGMHSPYKERWADAQGEYVGVFLGFL